MYVITGFFVSNNYYIHSWNVVYFSSVLEAGDDMRVMILMTLVVRLQVYVPRGPLVPTARHQRWDCMHMRAHTHTCTHTHKHTHTSLCVDTHSHHTHTHTQVLYLQNCTLSYIWCYVFLNNYVFVNTVDNMVMAVYLGVCVSSNSESFCILIISQIIILIV